MVNIAKQTAIVLFIADAIFLKFILPDVIGEILFFLKIVWTDALLCRCPVAYHTAIATG